MTRSVLEGGEGVMRGGRSFKSRARDGEPFLFAMPEELEEDLESGGVLEVSAIVSPGNNAECCRPSSGFGETLFPSVAVNAVGTVGSIKLLCRSSVQLMNQKVVSGD